MLATSVEAMEQDKGPRKGKAAADDMKPTAEPPRKCPRCDSPNTKFCYYNNYSSSQPRYICRACRRYWTEGGTLRNLPHAAAARRASKHSKRSSSTSITAAGPDTTQAPLPLFFSGLGGGFLRLPPAIPELLNPSLMLGPPPTPPVLGLPTSDEGDRLFNDLFGGVQDAADQAPRPPSASSGPFV